MTTLAILYLALFGGLGVTALASDGEPPAAFNALALALYLLGAALAIVALA